MKKGREGDGEKGDGGGWTGSEGLGDVSEFRGRRRGPNGILVTLGNTNEITVAAPLTGVETAATAPHDGSTLASTGPPFVLVSCRHSITFQPFA